MENYDNQKKVALVSHEASLTGAPIVLLGLAESLIDLGFSPTFFSRSEGPLEAELRKKNIKTFIADPLLISEEINKGCFKAVFINTIVNYDIVLRINESIKLFWWLHETPISYEHHSRGLKAIPKQQRENLRILSGGDYARATFLKFRPKYEIENFHYYVPETNRKCRRLPLINQFAVNFICAGTIEKRKGQDILVKAIRGIPKDLLIHAHFWFIGKPSDKAILSEINSLRIESYPVSYIDLVKQEVLNDFIYSSDFLVCPSRLDPLPMVVAIAMSQGTPVVLSESVGIKNIAEPVECNVIFGNSSKGLKDVLINLISNNCGRPSKVFFKQNIEQFDRYFSKKTFDINLKKLLDIL